MGLTQFSRYDLIIEHNLVSLIHHCRFFMVAQIKEKEMNEELFIFYTVLKLFCYEYINFEFLFSMKRDEFLLS